MAPTARSSQPAGRRIRRAGLTAALATVLLAGTVGVTASVAVPAESTGPGSSLVAGHGDKGPKSDKPKYDEPESDDPSPAPSPSESSDDDCDAASVVTRDRDDDDDDCPAPPPAPVVEVPAAPPAPAAAPPAPPAPKRIAAPLAASIFTGELTCGDVASQQESAEAAGVEVRRLSNADGSACEAVPYVLTSDEDSLRFLKNGSPYAQFIATVEWRYDLEPPTKTKTFVDFELIPGGYELTMPNCPAAVKKNGLLTGLPSLDSLTPESLLAVGITDMDGLPGTTTSADNGLVQYACVGSRSNRFVNFPGDEHYLLTEQIYILGDIFIRR